MPTINNSDCFINWALSPCKGCEDRDISCHGSCGLYASYKEELEENRKVREATRGFCLTHKREVKRFDGRKKLKSCPREGA